jgi:hypothetical protein
MPGLSDVFTCRKNIFHPAKSLTDPASRGQRVDEMWMLIGEMPQVFYLLSLPSSRESSQFRLGLGKPVEVTSEKLCGPG